MIFDRLDLSLQLKRAEYEREIKALQNGCTCWATRSTCRSARS